MILEIRTNDFRNKCANCKYFKTQDHIIGECINLENKLRPWNRKNRQYNSRACICKENVDGI